MQDSDIPLKFPIPFGNSAGSSYIRQVPTASQIGITNGAASLTDGYVPLNAQPVAAGGVPPFMQDTNGILNQSTAWIRWYTAGGPIAWDSAFSAAIGGYPMGAIVASTLIGGLWISLVDNNTTNPNASGAGWAPVGRIRLASNLSIYVATTGSDTANTGLTIGSPFATLQHAWNFISNTYDLNGFIATVNVANGTYSAGIVASGTPVGNTRAASGVQFSGNSASAADVTIAISGGNASCFQAQNGGQFSISSFTLTNTGTAFAVSANSSSFININGPIVFGACTTGHVASGTGSTISITSDYTISGSAPNHWLSAFGFLSAGSGISITLTGTPAFSTCFADANLGGLMNIFGNTFSGSATGSRYNASGNGIINTQGGGANYLPGNVAGAFSSGGEYI